MRLFYGISLPGCLRQAVAQHALVCRQAIPGRYVPAENYHMTLAFLGDVPENRVADASRVLDRCLASFPAPTLSLRETDYFGRPENAILICRVHSASPLSALHQMLTEQLAQENLPFDQGPFSPHVTLARHARTCAVFPRFDRPLVFSPSHAHLYLSARNTENRLVYTPIHTAAFHPSPDEG